MVTDLEAHFGIALERLSCDSSGDVCFEESAANAGLHLANFHVSFHAQTIAKSIQARPVVERTLDFVSSVTAANGMATRAISLAMRAALGALAIRTQPLAMMVAKKAGGVMLVRTHAQLVLWVDVIAKMESRQVVVQGRFQACQMMVQGCVSLAPQIAKTESVMQMVLVVKDAFWDTSETQARRSVNLRAMAHAMRIRQTRTMEIALLA